MKPFRAYLGDSLLAALIGLLADSLVGGLGLGFYAIIQETPGSRDVLADMQVGMVFSLIAALLGILPAFLYVAPVHALLSRRGISSYPSTVATSAAPGAILSIAPSRSDISFLVLYFGICMGLAGQWFANRRRTAQEQTDGSSM
jgi:hypothetical protein